MLLDCVISIVHDSVEEFDSVTDSVRDRVTVCVTVGDDVLLGERVALIENDELREKVELDVDDDDDDIFDSVKDSVDVLLRGFESVKLSERDFEQDLDLDSLRETETDLLAEGEDVDENEVDSDNDELLDKDGVRESEELSGEVLEAFID